MWEGVRALGQIRRRSGPYQGTRSWQLPVSSSGVESGGCERFPGGAFFIQRKAFSKGVSSTEVAFSSGGRSPQGRSSRFVGFARDELFLVTE